MNDQKWESACTTHTSCKYDNHDNIKVNTKDIKFQQNFIVNWSGVKYLDSICNSQKVLMVVKWIQVLESLYLNCTIFLFHCRWR